MHARLLRGLALGFAAATSPEPAAAYLSCQNEPFDGGPFLCADAWSRATAQGVDGTNATGAGVSYLNQVGGPADDTATAGGGMVGITRVDVDWGLVRAFASADNGTWIVTDFANPESRVLSYAQGAFADRGTLVSQTLPAGTPVEITVEMDVHGGFSDGAGGEVVLTLQKTGDGGSYLQKTATLSSTAGFVPPPFALQGFAVGDELIFEWLMTASAGTTNRVSPARVSALADMESTGLLFVDVGTPGVTLETMSGHDYTPAPEPARAILLAGVALLLVARGRRAGRVRRSSAYSESSRKRSWA
jgi:hypothetical protein